jgi:pilus assembly protein CpaB
MDRKGIALLLVALVLAIAAGGGVYLFLKGMPAVHAEVPDTVPVVVASKDMTFGTTLESQHLQVADFPKNAVPAGSYSSPDSVLLQTTKVFVVAGEPILASKLSAIGGGLSVRVPSNMRAMSMKINEVTGVSGFVLPGDRVDVMVTIPNAGGSNVAVTKTILQDLEVLASGAKTETKNDHHIVVQTVTVLVDPEGAEKLALGIHQGKVHLALRNPVDHEMVDGKRTDTKSVLGMSKPRKSYKKRTTPRKATKMKTTTKKPVAFEPDVFTVIRDGKIEKQESPTADKEESTGSGKK